MNTENEAAFNKKWSWLLLCKEVSEWLNESYYTTFSRNLYEVLTFATLISEKIEIEKAKVKK